MPQNLLRKNVGPKGLGALALVGLLALLDEGVAQAAGTITAEKNCAVRIEGGDFKEGDKVLVFREVAGKKKRLAIVDVTKRTGDGKALGRVSKGPTVCTGLKGASTEAYSGAGAKGGAAATASSNFTRLDAGLGTSFSMVSQRGLLVGKPGEQFAKDPARLKALGVELQLDAYPLAFSGNGFIQKALGIGLSFGYGSVFPKSDVPPKDNPSGAKVGTLATSLMSLEADLIFRLLYLEDRMATEIRTAVYLSHSITHKYAGEPEGTDSLPITNLSTSGLGVALKQRFRLTQALRLNAGFLFPFGLKGKASYLSGDSAALGKTSGYHMDLSADFFLEKIKFWGGLSYGSFGGSLAAMNQEQGVEEVYKLEDSRFVLMAGAGFHL